MRPLKMLHLWVEQRPTLNEAFWQAEAARALQTINEKLLYRTALARKQDLVWPFKVFQMYVES